MFFRAAQKLSLASKKKKQKAALATAPVASTPSSSNPPLFATNFSSALVLTPPPAPPCLLRAANKIKDTPGLGKVKVMVRVCPVSQLEAAESSSFLKVDPRKKQIMIMDPSANQTQASQKRAGANQVSPKMFTFDAAFPPDASQVEVCAGTVAEVIQSVVNGADGCVFCFGHSKLGKSYTMIGRDDSLQTLGVIPCAISWLFKLINERREKTGARFSVRVSAVEVWGRDENLKDLLSEVATGNIQEGQSPGVYLFEDPICGMQLQNQSELRAPTPEKAGWYLDAAIAARHNSRHPDTTEEEHRNSHMLFTLHLYQYRMDKTGKGGMSGGRSRLHLLDLGSCDAKALPGGGRSRENSSHSAPLCLSLSALGNVILALVNGSKHIPYKESKLTMLLRESLGNMNCRTTMIAHISASPKDFSETLSTVQIASRVLRMKKKKSKYTSSSSGGESSCEEGHMRRPTQLRPFHHCGGADSDLLLLLPSDPDEYSSSEHSCDTVIYVGSNGGAVSDRELTDNEGPPEFVPIIPTLPQKVRGWSAPPHQAQLAPVQEEGAECLKCNTFAELQERLDCIDGSEEVVTFPFEEVPADRRTRRQEPCLSYSLSTLTSVVPAAAAMMDIDTKTGTCWTFYCVCLWTNHQCLVPPSSPSQRCKVFTQKSVLQTTTATQQPLGVSTGLENTGDPIRGSLKEEVVLKEDSPRRTPLAMVHAGPPNTEKLILIQKQILFPSTSATAPGEPSFENPWLKRGTLEGSGEKRDSHREEQQINGGSTGSSPDVLKRVVDGCEMVAMVSQGESLNLYNLDVHRTASLPRGWHCLNLHDGLDKRSEYCQLSSTSSTPSSPRATLDRRGSTLRQGFFSYKKNGLPPAPPVRKSSLEQQSRAASPPHHGDEGVTSGCVQTNAGRRGFNVDSGRLFSARLEQLANRTHSLGRVQRSNNSSYHYDCLSLERGESLRGGGGVRGDSTMPRAGHNLSRASQSRLSAVSKLLLSSSPKGRSLSTSSSKAPSLSNKSLSQTAGRSSSGKVGSAPLHVTFVQGVNDDSSVLSGELPPAMGKTALFYHSGGSSGYESMVRDSSENTGSTSSTQDSLSEDSTATTSSRRSSKNSKKSRSSTGLQRRRLIPALTLDTSSSSSQGACWVDGPLGLQPPPTSLRVTADTTENFEIKVYKIDDVERLQRRRDRRVSKEVVHQPSARLRLLEHRQQRISDLRAKYQCLKKELELTKQHLMLEEQTWTSEFQLQQVHEVDSLEYLEALETLTYKLETRVNFCKAHLMMVTCFDVSSKH
uniref:Kinesin family member 26B n=1 Tax=Cynoglossus semilaevis TaxID=244447 RepID=A0A3P8VEW3_CYNSE